MDVGREFANRHNRERNCTTAAGKQAFRFRWLLACSFAVLALAVVRTFAFWLDLLRCRLSVRKVRNNWNNQEQLFEGKLAKNEWV